MRYTLFPIFSLLLLFAACTDDVFTTEQTVPKGLKLEAGVCDFGFNNTNDLVAESKRCSTRGSAETVDAVTGATGLRNNGYKTVFTPGAEIGIFAIKDGQICTECNNLHLKLDNDGLWKCFDKSKYLTEIEGAKYVAYYPYNEANTDKSIDNIISAFTPLEDQSSYYNYLRSDLLVSEEKSPSNGTLTLKFGHAMSLITVYYNGEVHTDLTIEGPVVKGKMFRFSYDYSYGGNTDDDRLDNNGIPTDLNTDVSLPYRYLAKPDASSVYHVYGTVKGKEFSRGIRGMTKGACYYISLAGDPAQGYEYATAGVDLGLPSGVIWSNFNIGAREGQTDTYYLDASGTHNLRTGDQKATHTRLRGCDRGDYYSWGESYTKYYRHQPTSSQTGTYNNSKRVGYSQTQYFDYPNYTIAPVNGNIAGTQYDVARSTLWRGEWRLPTEDEIDELVRNCTITLDYIYFESNDRYFEGTWDDNEKYTFMQGTNQVQAWTNSFGYTSTDAFKASPIYQNHLYMVPVYKFTSKINGKFIYFPGATWSNWTIDQLRTENTFNGVYLIHNQHGGMYYFTSNASHTLGRIDCCSYFEFRLDKNRDTVHNLLKKWIQGDNTTPLPYYYQQDQYTSSSINGVTKYGLTQEGSRYTGMQIRPVYGGKWQQ